MLWCGGGPENGSAVGFGADQGILNADLRV